MGTKTLKINIDDDYYNFLSLLACEDKKELSHKIKELLIEGRIMLAINKYKKSEASIEKAAGIAGVSLSKMIDILREYGVEMNLDYEDYKEGLKNLKKIW